MPGMASWAGVCISAFMSDVPCACWVCRSGHRLPAGIRRHVPKVAPACASVICARSSGNYGVAEWRWGDRRLAAIGTSVFGLKIVAGAVSGNLFIPAGNASRTTWVRRRKSLPPSSCDRTTPFRLLVDIGAQRLGLRCCSTMAATATHDPVGSCA